MILRWFELIDFYSVYPVEILKKYLFSNEMSTMLGHSF